MKTRSGRNLNEPRFLFDIRTFNRANLRRYRKCSYIRLILDNQWIFSFANKSWIKDKLKKDYDGTIYQWYILLLFQVKDDQDIISDIMDDKILQLLPREIQGNIIRYLIKLD